MDFNIGCVPATAPAPTCPATLPTPVLTNCGTILLIRFTIGSNPFFNPSNVVFNDFENGKSAVKNPLCCVGAGGAGGACVAGVTGGRPPTPSPEPPRAPVVGISIGSSFFTFCNATRAAVASFTAFLCFA